MNERLPIPNEPGSEEAVELSLPAQGEMPGKIITRSAGTFPRIWFSLALFLLLAAGGLVFWASQTVSGRLTGEAVGLAWHLAWGGAIGLSARDVPIDGKPSEIDLAVQADGAAWVEIRHPQAGAKLALGAEAASGRLLLPRSKLALIMDPELPDFRLGDPAIDEVPLPPFEVPRVGVGQVLALPVLLAKAPIQQGPDGTLVWKQGALSATAHFASGRLSRLVVRGVLPRDEALDIAVNRIPPGGLTEKIETLEILPDGTRSENVSRGIFLRSIDGLLAAVMP